MPYDLRHARAGAQPRGIGAQTHGAAHVGHVLLRLHQRDHRVAALGREFARVAVRRVRTMLRANSIDRHLHAEADAEERQLALARHPDRLDHPLDAAHAEAARHEQPVARSERISRARASSVKRSLDSQSMSTPVVVRDAAVDERFLHALVAVHEVRVLAHDGDAHARRADGSRAHHLSPCRRGRALGRSGSNRCGHALVEPLLVEGERDLVDRAARRGSR